MKAPFAIKVNIFFRVIVSLAYSGLGYYVAFISDYQLGTMIGLPITYLLGLLFIIYGLFRLVRAFIYYRESTNENDDEASENYGGYE